jgi:hypothetical protein
MLGRGRQVDKTLRSPRGASRCSKSSGPPRWVRLVRTEPDARPVQHEQGTQPIAAHIACLSRKNNLDPCFLLLYRRKRHLELPLLPFTAEGAIALLSRCLCTLWLRSDLEERLRRRETLQTAARNEVSCNQAGTESLVATVCRIAFGE